MTFRCNVTICMLFVDVRTFSLKNTMFIATKKVRTANTSKIAVVAHPDLFLSPNNENVNHQSHLLGVPSLGAATTTAAEETQISHPSPLLTRSTHLHMCRDMCAHTYIYIYIYIHTGCSHFQCSHVQRQGVAHIFNARAHTSSCQSSLRATRWR